MKLEKLAQLDPEDPQEKVVHEEKMELQVKLRILQYDCNVRITI